MKLTHQSLVMVFDCGSIGLHGDTFSVGWVLAKGPVILERARLAVPRGMARGTYEDREWCAERVPKMIATHQSRNEMTRAFWEWWKTARGQGALLCAECAWPVETRFLNECALLDGMESFGPHPLVDISSVMLAAGQDPMVTRERLAEEKPVHDPLADAIQSHRLLMEALKK